MRAVLIFSYADVPKPHQEHQVRRDINGSYASIELGRDCRLVLLAGKPTLPIISHSATSRLSFCDGMHFQNMKFKTVEEHSDTGVKSSFTTLHPALNISVNNS